MSKNDGVNQILCSHHMPCLKYEFENKEFALNDPKLSKTQSSFVLVKEETLLRDLPNEILSKIFQHVSLTDLFKLEQVDKRLREIVLNRVWPKNDTLSGEEFAQFLEQPRICNTQMEYQSRMASKFIKTIFSRTSIRHIELCNFIDLDYFPISLLLSLTPHLISLKLPEFNLEKSDLLNIAKYCPLLEELSLDSSLFNEECDDGLKHIFIKCSNIKYISLSSNFEFKGNVSFVNISTELRYLNIAECFEITSNNLKLIASRAKNLETLVLSYIIINGDSNDWLKKFSKLKFLDISNICDDFLDFSTFNELEMLSLTYDDGEIVNIESLQTSQHCKKLQALTIGFSYGREDTTTVFQTLKNLKGLECCHFGSAPNLTEIIDFVQACQIKYLAISSHGDIEDKVLCSLLTECISLTHLELFDITSLNYETIVNALNEECPQRQNILKFVIVKPPFELPQCNWCEIVPNENIDSRIFGHFTDVKVQYHNQKSFC